MKKFLSLVAIILLVATSAYTQKYITKTGFIRFYSDSPMEKIEAINRTVNAALDASTGDFVFKVLMKSFVFEKALMQEHFNEKYVESDKFPNGNFVGKVVNIKEVNFSKEGTYPVTVEGKLTIHGETKQISEKGSFEVKSNQVLGKAKFFIALADYKISIPSAVANNISKSIEVTVDVALDKFNQ